MTKIFRKIKYIKIEHLINVPFVELILKMILAMNDLQSADAYFKLIDENNKIKKYNFERGHKIYVIRISISILSEIFSPKPNKQNMIESIKQAPELNNILNKCSKEVKDRFINLYSCCKGQKNWQKFNDHILKLRHKIGFHYDVEKIFNAAQKLSKLDTLCKIEIANNISKWRFHIGDSIIDELVCTLWNIDSSQDKEQEADKKMKWIMKIRNDYLFFAGNFVEMYLRDYNLFK